MAQSNNSSRDHLNESLMLAHARDVDRARTLVKAGIAAAEAEWVPRIAVMEALAGLLNEMSRPTKVVCFDA